MPSAALQPRHGLDTMAPLLARMEAEALSPPEGLAGAPLAMFTALAAGNKSRPWNQSHALALADYCRVCVLWGMEMDAVEREGAHVAGKPNARLKTMAVLSMERVRLAKVLGITVGSKDAYLTGSTYTEQRVRKMGALMEETARGDVHGYLR